MKSMHWNAEPGGAALVQAEIPRPAPGPDEVLVRIHAAGVTPTEALWYPTSHTKTGEPRSAAVPSHEFSGQVEAVGRDVSGLSVGEAVYGLNDWFAEGATAEYCITRPEWIAPKPQSLSHIEAASVPIAALTAWQGLFDRGGLRAGERVLVHGGAGSVGVFAIQLARRHGAHVLTTVSAHNLEFVKELGAREAIDYKATPFERQARNIDLVFDTVGGDTLQRSWAVLKPGGRLVTIAADSEDTADVRTKQSFFIVETRRDQLLEIGRLLDSGDLRPVVDTVLPFSRAADAYEGRFEKKGRGKVVVAILAAAGSGI